MSRDKRILSSNDELEEKAKENNREIVKSFNDETTLSKETRLLIIGTLTPPKTNYFYCSCYNRIYGYIDEALKQLGKSGEQTLKELKRGFQRVRNNVVKIKLLTKVEIKRKKDKIKEILRQNGIAFYDVVDKAIRKKETPYDKDIMYFTLANVQEVGPRTTIIVNSDLAFACAKEIGFKIDEKNKLSQRWDKKEKWVETIKAAIK